MTVKPHVSLHQFEVFNELVRRGRRAWVVNLLFGTVTLAAVLLAFMSFTRPLPVIVRGDDPGQQAQLVFATTDATVREIDAKRFFLKTTERLHGWNSVNVQDEFRSASLLMTTEWRQRFKAELMAPVDVPTEVNQTGRASKLASYVAARIRNELDVDWDSLKCSKALGLWHCKAKAIMKIQPLLGLPIDDAKLRKSLLLKASFTEVPPTLNTVDGLLVSFWDAKEPE